MTLVLEAGPTDPVLTLEKVKAYLRVDHTDEDNTVQAFITAATQRLDGRDGILGRALRPQVWRYECSTFGGIKTPVRLPLPPTIEVLNVGYYNAAGTLVDMDPANYRAIDGGWSGAYIIPSIGFLWPDIYLGEVLPDAVQVSFRAGYLNLDSPDDEAIPEPIRIAMLMLIGDWYENRLNTIVGTNVAELPQAVQTLIAPYRVIPIA